MAERVQDQLKRMHAQADDADDARLAPAQRSSRIFQFVLQNLKQILATAKEHTNYILEGRYDSPFWEPGLRLCYQCALLSKLMACPEVIFRCLLIFGHILTLLNRLKEASRVYLLLRDIGEDVQDIVMKLEAYRLLA